MRGPRGRCAVVLNVATAPKNDDARRGAPRALTDAPSTHPRASQSRPSALPVAPPTLPRRASNAFSRRSDRRVLDALRRADAPPRRAPTRSQRFLALPLSLLSPPLRTLSLASSTRSDAPPRRAPTRSQLAPTDAPPTLPRASSLSLIPSPPLSLAYSLLPRQGSYDELNIYMTIKNKIK